MYDAIVIGVGGMGSATLFHLARSGAKVLGVEQFGIPHAFGSSHGSTRIIRLAYSEGPEYVPLLRAAYRYWRELEAVSGRSILKVTGGLDIGPEGSWTIEGSRQSCVEHGLAFEELGGREVNRRFPGYRLPDPMRAVYQPDGGYVRSEAAIEAYAAAARAAGAEIVTDAPVRGWERRTAGWRVHAAGERYDARKLVVTAGPWVGALLPDLRAVCRPERQVMLWTEPLQADVFEPGRFPVFNMESPSGRYYGFPDDRGEGFKIGKYWQTRRRDPAIAGVVDQEPPGHTHNLTHVAPGCGPSSGRPLPKLSDQGFILRHLGQELRLLVFVRYPPPNERLLTFQRHKHGGLVSVRNEPGKNSVLRLVLHEEP
ncbi:MAG: N-methyl-L-tryptophan oxidase [Acidobacteria bacterium]|nr:N-methyl-L-tryptophan oxidase [Acidobacteriota bacterium]